MHILSTTLIHSELCEHNSFCCHCCCAPPLLCAVLQHHNTAQVAISITSPTASRAQVIVAVRTVASPAMQVEAVGPPRLVTLPLEIDVQFVDTEIRRNEEHKSVTVENCSKDCGVCGAED